MIGQSTHTISAFPVRSLAAEVLAMALLDATSPVGSHQYGTCRLPIDVRLARAFCTDTVGGWAESRELWCDACGVDAEAFLRHARRVIAVAA